MEIHSIRKRFPNPEAGAKDDEMEHREEVYHVTMENLKTTKWPAAPKVCAMCKNLKGEPDWKENL